MEKIDPKKARAVWARVMEARRGEPKRPPMPPMPGRPPERPPMPPMPGRPPERPPMPPMPEQPSEHELREWLAEISALARGYRSMKAGRFTQLLQRMGTEEQAHYRQLAALYFLLYGRRAEPMSGAAPGRRSLAADLRDAYGEEQRAARQWREAAARYPAQRELFERFARDDRRHAEQLRRVMAANL